MSAVCALDRDREGGQGGTAAAGPVAPVALLLCAVSECYQSHKHDGETCCCQRARLDCEQH
jgi:hypothetical protein